MQTDLRLNNTVKISGRIISDFEFSHEVYSEKFYSFFIESNRLSETSDILPVTASEILIERLSDNISIDGQIRSYNSYRDGKNHLLLTVFAKQIRNADEGEMPNTVELNGFICRKPVFRTTPFGREITDILLAVNRSYNKSDYIPCICWGRTARFAGNLDIGDNIAISGRMQSRIYRKKDSEGGFAEKTAYEVSISKLELNKS